VLITLANDGTDMAIEVRDDGCGLPEGFDIEATTSLGLSIVRDLVVGQLQGSIELQAVPEGAGGGTVARFVVPVPSRV
jgi:two-component sensor histidine kinase